MPAKSKKPRPSDVKVTPPTTLRVWWIPQVPGKPFHVPVADLAQAKLILDTLARYDLFQLEHRIKPDYANVGGLEVFEDGEWIEWEDEEGRNIDAVMCMERAA